MKRILQHIGKSRGLQILMAASFFITGIIAVYAVHIKFSSDKALKSALENKIRFASWVYGTAVEEQLKRSSYQTLQDVLRSVEKHDGKLSVALDPEKYNTNRNENKNSNCNTNYLKPVQGVFVYDPDNRQFAGTAFDKRIGDEFSRWIENKVSNFSTPTGDLHKATFVNAEGKEYMVVMARAPGLSPLSRELVFGLRTSVKNLEYLFKETWENHKILPGSLTEDQAADEFMAIEIFTEKGSQVFASGKPSREKISIESKVGGEFDFLTGNIAISNPSGTNLAGGGIYGDSNTILVILFAIATTLGIIGFIQFRNESELIRMKRELISNVSHELRTPVTQIRMFSETLNNGRTRNEDEVNKSLQIIEKESKRLSRLISNILDFSASEKPILNIDPQKIRVDHEVEQVIHAFTPLAETASNNIKLNLEPVSAFLDPSGVKQILINVLDNAVKYGPEGQQIDIRLKKHKTRVILSVADEGPGIPEKIHEKVWEPNWRNNGSFQHAKTGSGIGLSVVKQYVEQMNGSAEIRNRKEKGTKFIFRFPINLGGDQNE